MVYLFYNKLLLRVLVLLAGIGVGMAAFQYVTLSAQKLPEHGARDAQAIISFLVAGWMVMLIAEVVDNHYMRVFGTLCVGLGAWVSYPWIFRHDGPALLAMPGAIDSFQVLRFGFWSAVIIAGVMLALLVTRLSIDKLTYGRRPVGAAKKDRDLGAAPEGAGKPAQADELPPIPLDTAPLAVTTGAEPQTATQSQPVTPARAPAPVKRLSGVGGVYLGNNYDLAPGELRIGRADADIELANDTQVSRNHASIVVDEAGLATLSDKGSTNGTFVNNERIDSLQLAPGDMVRIGTTLFKVEA